MACAHCTQEYGLLDFSLHVKLAACCILSAFSLRLALDTFDVVFGQVRE